MSIGSTGSLLFGPKLVEEGRCQRARVKKTVIHSDDAGNPFGGESHVPIVKKDELEEGHGKNLLHRPLMCTISM